MSGRRMEFLHIWTIKGGKGSEGVWEEARECGDSYLQKGFSHKTFRLPVRVHVQDGPEDFLSAAFPIRQIADDIV